MIFTVTKLTLKPGQSEAFETFFRAAAAEVAHTEPGILLYRLARSAENPLAYAIIEHYADQAALEAHLKKVAEAGAAEMLAGLVSSPPVFEIFHDVG